MIYRGGLNFELKNLSEEGEHLRITGMASTYELDSHNERVLPGAFGDVRKNNPVLLWQHDMTQPIGVFGVLEETKDGLYMEALLPRNDDMVKGRVIPQVKIGAIGGLSIGFMPKKSAMRSGVREISSLELYEVSLVSLPANSGAVISGMKSGGEDDLLEKLCELLGIDPPVEADAIDIEELRGMGASELSKRLRRGQPMSRGVANLISKGVFEVLKPTTAEKTDYGALYKAFENYSTGVKNG